MHIMRVAKEYLRERQSPAVRGLHIGVFFLVLSQIVVSNFIKFNKNGEISSSIVEYYGTWIHIISGIILIPIALIFVLFVMKGRGFKYFFPYFYGNYFQLKNDFMQLKQLKLPEPSAYGVASTVQGLGMSALFLVLLSGLIWFVSWSYGAPWSDVIKELHGLLTGLVIAYVVGHSSMGALHIFHIAKRQAKPNKAQ